MRWVVLSGGCLLCGILMVIQGVLSTLSPEALAFIQSEESLVRRVAESAVSLHNQRVRLVGNCVCSKHACSNDFDEAPCVHQLGTPEMCSVDGRRVESNSSIFRTPPGANPNDLSSALKESICVYKTAVEVEPQSENHYGWLYLGRHALMTSTLRPQALCLGTRDGHFRRSPGSASLRDVPGGDRLLGDCKTYDPRVRPWYIAASTGPKDIVIVVDKSGSMYESAGSGRASKWDVTERAVRDILGSLNFADFVNVVTFSNDAEALETYPRLVRGRTENIAALQSKVATVVPGGGTDFRSAFREAFRLLTDGCDEEGECSNCHKVILFLTDGMDTSMSGDSVQPSVMLDVIESLQTTLESRTGSRASIFTYSISTAADDNIPRQIACANGGAWSFVGATTNILDALNSYYLYFAASKTNRAIWVDPYEDADGLGLLTTVAIPFYAETTGDQPDVFLGVVGHDVGFHELEVGGVTARQALDAIIERSGRCRNSDITDCEMQFYRNAHDARSECPDTPAVTEGIAGSCFQFGDRYYKRISSLSWTDADTACTSDGGELASVEDEEELGFVANIAAADGSWVGAYHHLDNQFRWLDTSAGELNHSSSYWAASEPRDASSISKAVIDPRGRTGNLRVERQTELLSAICEYPAATACASGVTTLPSRGYFDVPPVSVCSSAELLDATQPVEGADHVSSNTVMCDLGAAKSNEAVICCNHSFITDEPWFTAVLTVAAVGAFIACVVCHRRCRARAAKRFNSPRVEEPHAANHPSSAAHSSAPSVASSAFSAPPVMPAYQGSPYMPPSGPQTLYGPSVAPYMQPANHAPYPAGPYPPMTQPDVYPHEGYEAQTYPSGPFMATVPPNARRRLLTEAPAPTQHL